MLQMHTSKHGDSAFCMVQALTEEWGWTLHCFGKQEQAPFFPIFSQHGSYWEPHRVPAKWRERRAMRVTVRARPSTASERCCQKPCTSGVDHRSLPSAVRNCLSRNRNSALHALFHILLLQYHGAMWRLVISMHRLSLPLYIFSSTVRSVGGNSCSPFPTKARRFYA